MTDFHEKKKPGLGLKVIFSWMHISSVRRRAPLHVCEASGAFLGNNIGFRASCRCILIILLMFFISCASSVKMKDTLNTFWSHLETFCIILWVLLQHSLAQAVSLDQKNINSELQGIILRKTNLIVIAPYKLTIARKKSEMLDKK